MSLRIALVGYGKMGKAVEAEARARGHEICLIVDQDDAHLATLLRPETCDCFIEFTPPGGCLGQFQEFAIDRRTDRDRNHRLAPRTGNLSG